MPGHITVIAGPMRCDSYETPGPKGTVRKLGKSSLLCLHGWQSREWSPPVGAFKPKRDDRDAVDFIVPHKDSGIEPFPCRRVWQAGDANPDPQARVVLVDEAHLFPDPQALFARCLEWREQEMEVFVAGCDLAHTGGPFDWYPMLSALADDVLHMTGRCACSARSTHTFRHGMDDCLISPGDLGRYEPCCARCHEILWGARRARATPAALPVRVRDELALLAGWLRSAAVFGTEIPRSAIQSGAGAVERLMGMNS